MTARSAAAAALVLSCAACKGGEERRKAPAPEAMLTGPAPVALDAARLDRYVALAEDAVDNPFDTVRDTNGQLVMRGDLAARDAFARKHRFSGADEAEQVSSRVHQALLVVKDSPLAARVEVEPAEVELVRARRDALEMAFESQRLRGPGPRHGR